MARARTAVGELARMAATRSPTSGSCRPSGAKLTLEAMQRTADAFTPKA
ncbi:MAG: hypothetical protein R3B06_30590 [Kofleriaceae bacterium]